MKSLIDGEIDPERHAEKIEKKRQKEGEKTKCERREKDRRKCTDVCRRSLYKNRKKAEQNRRSDLSYLPSDDRRRRIEEKDFEERRDISINFPSFSRCFSVSCFSDLLMSNRRTFAVYGARKKERTEEKKKRKLGEEEETNRLEPSQEDRKKPVHCSIDRDFERWTCWREPSKTDEDLIDFA